MLVETKKMIPITQLQKDLSKRVKEVSENHEPIYVLKNNQMEAVILSFDDYEYLMKLEDMIEHFEIDEVIKARMENYNSQNNLSWSDIKED